MKKPKVIGYIVVSQDSGVYKLGSPGTDEGKSLWFGPGATLFPTRRRAYVAINKTKKYREENGYAWPWIDTSYIMAVYAA